MVRNVLWSRGLQLVYMADTPGTVFDFGGRDRHFEFQTYAVCVNGDGKLTFLGGMRWSIKELDVYSWVSRRLFGGYTDSHSAWRPLKKPSMIQKRRHANFATPSNCYIAHASQLMHIARRIYQVRS